MAARGIHGLGVLRGAVAAPLHPMGARAARSFFEDPEAEPARAARWAGVARADRALGADVKAWRTKRFGAGVAPVAEPFLYVEVDWQDGTTSRWGEVDRPTADFQIHGRIVSVGELERGFTDDRLISRTTWSLAITDVGDELGSKLASGAWSRSRWSAWIGYPELPFADWQLIASGLRFDRAPVRPDSGTYECELIDALDDELGGDVQLPRYELVSDAEWQAAAARAFSRCDPSIATNTGTIARTWEYARDFTTAPRWSDSIAADEIPVPFGREFVTPLFAWGGEPSSIGATEALGYVHLGIIGASRNPDWMQSHFIDGTDPDNELQVWAFPKSAKSGTLRIVPPYPVLGGRGNYHPPNGLDISVQVVKLESATNGTWYIAVLLAVIDGTRLGGQFNAGLNAYLSKFRELAEFEYMRFLVPHGAESRFANEWSTIYNPWPHDAPAVALELIGRYGQDAGPLIDEDSFADAATADGIAGTWVGGLIEKDGALRDVLERLCSTYRMDIYRSVDGKIRIRTQAATAKDLTERIPAAPTWTDDYDLTAFRATPEIGDTRWGVANRFQLEGVRETAIALQRGILSRVFVDQDVEDSLDLGRPVERKVDVSWFPQLDGGNADWFVGALRELAALPYSIQRFKVEVDGGLHLLEQDLGAWVRITHWAGPSATPGAGWTEKLCMVERVRLRWAERSVSVQLVNRDELDTEKPWVLDDEEIWKRLEPKSAAAAIALSAGSDIIQTSGWAAWSDEGVEAGDLIEIYDTAITGSRACVRIASINIDEATVVDDDGNPWLAAATETLLTGWRVWRGHTTPPDNTSHPGKYPAGSNMYGRCADETSGEFSNTAPGYVMSGGT